MRNEKINLKVREHSLTKAPIMLVVGRREAEEGKVTMRRLGSPENVTMELAAAITLIRQEAVPPDIRRARASGGMS